MVNIRENSGDRPIRVVASAENSSVNVYHDIDNLYSGEAKDWAIKMDGKVNNEDYSSKYWAADSKSSAEIAAGYAATASDIAETVAGQVADALLYATNSANSASAASASATSASGYKDAAEIWAEGTDEEVEDLGGVHSAKGWAELADTEQVQSDWSVSDTSSKAFIKNKPDLSVYITSSALSGYAQTSDIPTKVSDLTNDSGFITSSSLPTKVSDLTNDSGFITSSALSGYAQTSDIPTKVSDLTNDSGFITSSSLPTKVSDLTNDSGFITSSALSGYAQTSDIPTTAADVSALPDSTKYGNGLSYSNDVLSLVDQDGTTLDSVTITSSGSTPAAGGISLPIGSNVICDHTLSYEECANLEPAGGYLYKTGVTNQYQAHPETYQLLLTEYNNASETVYLDKNVTIVGSLANNNGVLSNFSSTNYATLPSNFAPGANPWEIVIKIHTANEFNGNPDYICSSYQDPCIVFNIAADRVIAFSIGSGSGWVFTGVKGTTVLNTNTDYWAKLEFTGTQYKSYLSTDGITFSQEAVHDSTATIPSYPLNLGVPRDLYSINITRGSIDLNGCYVNINGSRWWTGTKFAQKSEKDRLFYDVSIKQCIDAIYSSTGSALMWGVDETNERLILPRTNFYNSAGKLYYVV